MPPTDHFSALSPDGVAAMFQSKLGLLALGLGGLVFYGMGFIFYRLFLHPLAKVPGPRLCAITENPYLYKEFVEGSGVQYVSKLHRKYGPIVRTGPNRLAIDGSVAVPQVLSHRKGRPEYQKQPGFFTRLMGFESIIGAPTDIHRRQRRHLAHAFSEAAMYEQEPIINKYVSMLIQRLSVRAETGEAFDISKWLNFTTFDVIGDLTFGESFHCLDSSGYHPWVEGIFKGVRGGALIRFYKAIPFLKPLLTVAMSHPDMRKNIENNELAFDRARSRISQGESPGGRRDIMTYMLRNSRDGEKMLAENEILINSPLLVVAGSETTASALSGLLFHLKRNPEVYKILTDEIRSAFESEEEIGMRTTAKLKYLHAVIEETLRMYPPAAATPPRVSPGDVIGDYFVPEGTIISTYQWATFHNPDNFVDPDSFKPQRFLPTSDPRYEHRFDGDNRACFKPFSAGPRDCLGKNLAYAEMRVIVSRFFYRFDYEFTENLDAWVSSQRTYVVWEKGPLMIKLTPRQG